MPNALRQKRKQLQQHWTQLSAQNKNADALFDAALHNLAQNHYQTFLDALTRYRNHAIMRDLPEPPVLWRAGTTRLLDFSDKKNKTKPVVLIIPSLINRYHVLDMDKKQSFVRDLAKAGFRPLLLDWGVPGAEEITFGFDEYLTKRLFPALNYAQKMAGEKVHVIGYCMGGLLAAALAVHAADAIRSLVFLATPWDFHSDKDQAARVKKMLPQLEPIIKQQGELPVDVLQCFFISLQPFALLDKFLRFAAMKKGSAEERTFVLIEDWVNEGVPLAGNVAMSCLQGWYGENTPICNTWKILGKSIRPQEINLPSLHVIPQNDKIVPPASAKALAGLMRKSTVLQPEFGHISMMVNAAARDRLWPSVFSWLASH